MPTHDRPPICYYPLSGWYGRSITCPKDQLAALQRLANTTWRKWTTGISYSSWSSRNKAFPSGKETIETITCIICPDAGVLWKHAIGPSMTPSLGYTQDRSRLDEVTSGKSWHFFPSESMSHCKIRINVFNEQWDAYFVDNGRQRTANQEGLKHGHLWEQQWNEYAMLCRLQIYAIQKLDVHTRESPGEQHWVENALEIESVEIVNRNGGKQIHCSNPPTKLIRELGKFCG